MIIKRSISILLLTLLEKVTYNLITMNYATENFSWFESPDFKKNQDALLKRNDLFKNAIQQNEAFNIENVFDSSEHLKDEKLQTPNLTGNDQFSAFAANNPIPKDLFGTEKLETTDAAAKTNALGTQGQGQAGAIAGFGMKGIEMLSSTSKSEGESITNGLDMTMKGAQAGMTVGGPVGAAVGAGLGLAVGIYDGFADAGKRGKAEREMLQKQKEKDHTVLEQEQRQKDGLDSLSNLSALRKQQENFII